MKEIYETQEIAIRLLESIKANIDKTNPVKIAETIKEIYCSTETMFANYKIFVKSGLINENDEIFKRFKKILEKAKELSNKIGYDCEKLGWDEIMYK